MKNPIYSKFTIDVEEFLSTRSKDDLKKIILNIASQQKASERNSFLDLIKDYNISAKKETEKNKPEITPDELFNEINTFEEDIEAGLYYDEEKSMIAWDIEDSSSWRNYYEEDEDVINYSDEKPTIKAAKLLKISYYYYSTGEINTACKAYTMLFKIFDKDDYYNENEYLTYGYTFKEAIGLEKFNHQTAIFIRCLYLVNSPLNEVLNRLLSENLMLSDFFETDHTPLPNQDVLIEAYISLLLKEPHRGEFLADAIYIKGGMDAIKEYALKYGKKHPSLILNYFTTLKEMNSAQSDLLEWILQGIAIILEKYSVRAILAYELISIAKKTKNRNHLLLGLEAAFYSHPDMNNLTFLLDFYLKNKLQKNLKQLKEKFLKYNIKKGEPLPDPLPGENIYSLHKSKIDVNTIILGKYLLEGIIPLSEIIDTRSVLGFSYSKKYIATLNALILKTLCGSINVRIVDLLLKHYFFDYCTNETIDRLLPLISDKVQSIADDEKKTLLRKLKTIEKVAVKRVVTILDGKKRGGYESSCLLLTACAEAEQVLNNNGNELIEKINKQYKRFSAFRVYLKDFTAKSTHLKTIT